MRHISIRNFYDILGKEMSHDKITSSFIPLIESSADHGGTSRFQSLPVKFQDGEKKEAEARWCRVPESWTDWYFSSL